MKQNRQHNIILLLSNENLKAIEKAGRAACKTSEFAYFSSALMKSAIQFIRIAQSCDLNCQHHNNSNNNLNFSQQREIIIKTVKYQEEVTLFITLNGVKKSNNIIIIILSLSLALARRKDSQKKNQDYIAQLFRISLDDN